MKFKVEEIGSYSVMPNAFLQDNKLSLKAKGLLATIYYLPNEWDYSVNGLCAITNTKITAMRSTLTELEINGYLTRKQTKDKEGKWEYIYIIHIKPKKRKIKNALSTKRWLESHNL